MAEDGTRDGTGLVLVGASQRGAWRGAVLPGLVGVLFAAAGVTLSELGLTLAGLAFVLVGVLRWIWWARVCSTSQLVDRDDSLVWMYRGEIREAVAWSDLRHVLFDRWSRQVIWAIGGHSGGPFPFVLVDSRADRPSGFRHFAEVMVIPRVDLEAGDRALAEACHRHAVTYHGINSDW